jgi:molecular chaperone GrpE
VSDTPHSKEATPEAEPGPDTVVAPTTPPGAAESAPPVPQPAEIAALEDRWRRAVADLDNLRKRYARELERERQAERDRVVAAFLPALDSLELALEHAADHDPAIVDGVRAVHDQAIELLRTLGYPRQDRVGVPFDTTLHEAIAAVPAPDVPPGTVVRVLRPGYGDADRPLRPAAVAVSRQE